MENLPTLGNGLVMTVDVNANDVTLLVGVPEPGTMGLIALAGALGAVLRRRRR